ncbi:MAG: TRAM domain-containing protein [Verrucomicrobia bacterium]|nr:TRAM domain-containing protein [Verrucomicrobiota bacterium]
MVPRFVLKELQQLADSNDARNEVKIHDGDFPDEQGVDAKLVHLARNLGAKLYTNDYNLGQIAELQKVTCVNLHDLAKCLRVVLLPGEMLTLRIVREGKDKGQGVGYLPDGTMVVVNNAQNSVGQQVEVQVQSQLQTGAGVIVFADLKGAIPA